MRAHPFIWFALLLLLIAGPESASADFMPLGDLPGGIFESSSSAVSRNGMVAVGASGSALSVPSSLEAFRCPGFLPGGNLSVADGVCSIRFCQHVHEELERLSLLQANYERNAHRLPRTEYSVGKSVSFGYRQF